MKWDISDDGHVEDRGLPARRGHPRGRQLPVLRHGRLALASVRSATEETCTECLLCWIICPDSAIHVEDEKLADAASTSITARAAASAPNECPVEAKSTHGDRHGA